MLCRQIRIFAVQITKCRKNLFNSANIRTAADQKDIRPPCGNPAFGKFMLQDFQEFIFHAEKRFGFSRIGKIQLFFHNRCRLLFPIIP